MVPLDDNRSFNDAVIDMSNAEYNDTQIALLASLLEPASYPISEYLEALENANGDISKAAEALLLPRVKSAGKRKAGTSIQSWRGKKKHGDISEDENAGTWRGSAESTLRNPVSRDPATDLLSLLRKESPSKPAKAKTLPQPALLLTSQASIDAHGLPATMVQSPLSPSLASALYLALMEESELWDRNRWYLAGRWVESPHTTTVYARKGAGYGSRGCDIREAAPEDGDDPAKRKARYYYSGTELGDPKVRSSERFQY